MSNTRNIREPSIDALRDIVSQKQAAKFRFRDGEKTRLVLVDLFTASAIVTAHGAVSDENRAKIERMIAGTFAQFARVQRIALGVSSCTIGRK